LPQISIFIIFRPFGATKKVFRPFGAKQKFPPIKIIIPGKKLRNFSKILNFFLPQISIFIIFRPFGATKKVFLKFRYLNPPLNLDI